MNGLNTYVIGNRINPKGIVVMYSDVFSLQLPNNKIIADAYAKDTDYLVYMPDFFKGDPVKLQLADVMIPVNAAEQSTFSKYTGLLASAPSFAMWMTRHKFEPTNKTCMDWLADLRRDTPRDVKIGMVGFCWGGRFALRATMESNMISVDGEKVPLIDAAVALHPSNLNTPDDVQNPVVPITIGWGLEDTNTPIATKDKVEAAYRENQAAGFKLPVIEHVTYKPGRHGFAVRGNPDDPQERKCLEDSEKQVLDWFKRFL